MSKKRKPKELYSGECVDSMDRPNLLVPLESCDDIPSRFFPLLKIILEDEDGDRDDACGLFFDPMHGPNWWEWHDRAPTWMDPHLFVKMAEKHKRLQQCLAVCFKRNSERPAVKDMPEMLDEVMEEYLEYMLDRFELAKPLLVSWLVRNYCSKETNPSKQRKKRKKRVSRPAQ